MSEPKTVTDLFGQAVTLPSGARGRPSHRWSVENENRVLLGLAMGLSTAEIANGLGISTPTLRKHYFSALKRREMQRTRFELWRGAVLADQAQNGNIGAMRELGKIIDRHDARQAARELTEAQGDAPAPRMPKGKKEQARLEAQEALSSDEWGHDLIPTGTIPN